MHVGNGSTALLCWLSIRARGGELVMRMEDLDRPRVRPGSAERILDDLAWMGIDWDEGPDVGGEHGPYEQSRLDHRYGEAFEKLRERDLVYPCFCSRKDIAAAASAPQEPGDELRYPGNCRGIDPVEAAARIEGGARHAWRFRVDESEAPPFHDLVWGERGGEGSTPPGDFVVRRADGTSAYQLAVVVDDAAMGITEVVRGDDLLNSTARQVLLYRALDLPVPDFAHVPLLLGEDGVRLSKRHHGVTLREMRETGRSPEQVVGRLAFLLGLRDTPDPVSAAEMVNGFSFRRIGAGQGGIRVDEPFL
jgi:glutamyl-tRNA synthetase